jgi:hypothetical protein
MSSVRPLPEPVSDLLLEPPWERLEGPQPERVPEPKSVLELDWVPGLKLVLV